MNNLSKKEKDGILSVTVQKPVSIGTLLKKEESDEDEKDTEN